MKTGEQLWAVPIRQQVIMHLSVGAQKNQLEAWSGRRGRPLANNRRDTSPTHGAGCNMEEWQRAVIEMRDDMREIRSDMSAIADVSKFREKLIYLLVVTIIFMAGARSVVEYLGP